MAAVDDVEHGHHTMSSVRSPAIVAIENSSPEIIHVMNTSSPGVTTLASGISPHIVNLPNLGTSGHQVQTITINAGGLSFPVAVPASQAHMV